MDRRYYSYQVVLCTRHMHATPKLDGQMDGRQQSAGCASVRVHERRTVWSFPTVLSLAAHSTRPLVPPSYFPDEKAASMARHVPSQVPPRGSERSAMKMALSQLIFTEREALRGFGPLLGESIWKSGYHISAPAAPAPPRRRRRGEARAAGRR